MTNEEKEEILNIINFENEWLFDANSHNADTKIAFSTIKSKIAEMPTFTPKAESEDKKDIERQMWDDFHELTAKYYYYINAYEDMTKAGLPPCFTPRIDAKYIKCLADGIEQALGAIVTATKDLTERSGIDGEQRGQG